MAYGSKPAGAYGASNPPKTGLPTAPLASTDKDEKTTSVLGEVSVRKWVPPWRMIIESLGG